MARVIIIALLWLLPVLPALPFAENLSTSELGTVGEELADQEWQKTGRQSLLPPRFGNPNTHGPDRVYRTQNGTIELHETKAYKRWPTVADLETTVDSKPAMQLSKAHVQNWIAKPQSSFHKLPPNVQQAIKNGNFARRVNFINSTTTEFRAYELEAVGQGDIILGSKELLGPYKIARSRIKSAVKQAQALMRSAEIAANEKSILSKATSYTIGKSDDPFKNLKANNFAKKGGTRVVPGLLTADGRLLVACGKGATTTLGTIAVEGGIAYYQYWSGDIEESTLNEKLEDAAIKAAVVGGGVAVAVLLGSGPGVILAIGIGSYIIADFAVQQWRENTKDRFLTLKDLTDIGVPVDPNISLNVEQWSSQRN